MEWHAVVHATLGIPVLPAPEQLVLAYCSTRNQFAIGHCRGGNWQLQPTPGGAITHWAALNPPTSASQTAPQPGSAKPLTARYTVPAPPQPPPRKR